jgi:hypothetical protein
LWRASQSARGAAFIVQPSPCHGEKDVKTIVLQMPAQAAVADRMDSGVRRLVNRLRVSLARASEAPMELSDTERVVREAEALRAAFLRGRR